MRTALKTIVAAAVMPCLGGFPLWAQYNLSSEAPLNPVPIRFHRDHFFLHGDVKKYVAHFPNEPKITYFFDQSGYLFLKIRGEVKTHYVYDEDHRLEYITTYYDFDSKNPIRLNHRNQPIEMEYPGIGSEKYEYDGDGNFVRQYDVYLSGDRFLSLSYRYDKEGRLAEQQQFSADTLLRRMTYTYDTEGGFLKVTTTINASAATVAYYKDGQYVGPDTTLPIRYDLHHNPLRSAEATYTYTYFSDPSDGAEHGACVSGDCQDGWGRFIHEQSNYLGFWEKGLRHGYAYYLRYPGQVYEGQWREGRQTGLGIHILDPNDGRMQQGEFADGKLDGLGILHTGTQWRQGVYQDGVLYTSYPLLETGRTTGCVAGDCTHQYGKYVYDNGDYFVGFWKEGHKYLGYYFFSPRDFYFGYFNPDGEFDNFGFYQRGGRFYAGEWRDGQYHGKGYLKLPQGEESAGIWREGQLIRRLDE